MHRASIVHLYRSPGHNFFGHHGGPPSAHPILECESLSCVAGRGVEGDRFFDYKPDYRGQITFFAAEVHERLAEQFRLHDIPPAVFRRNVVVRGLDLNALAGMEFTVQGVRFLGTGECKPCHWMDTAFHPGTHAALQGHGGLRAKILTDGMLRRGPANAVNPTG